MKRWLFGAGLVACLAAAGCGVRQRPAAAPPSPASPAVRRNYVDLEEGWRVVVVTPMLAGGGFVLGAARGEAPVDLSEVGATKVTLTMKAGDEFLGFEESHYAVEAKGRVKLERVEITREGKKETVAKPRLALFELPREVKWVRLIYLRKVREGESHNMAVVGAADREGLEAVTREVEADPVKGCGMEKGRVCRWVPAGVAVRPERREGSSWVPVR